MKKIFSTFFILFSFFLSSCSAPVTGSISHTRPGTSSGIQLPDSFQDIRWSEWRGYDENYEYSVNINTNGNMTWASMFAQGFSEILGLDTGFNLGNPVPANIHDRSAEFSGTANGWINNGNNYQNFTSQVSAKLEADPNWLEGTLYLEVNPDLNQPVSKKIRMRRAFNY